MCLLTKPLFIRILAEKAKKSSLIFSANCHFLADDKRRGIGASLRLQRLR